MVSPHLPNEILTDIFLLGTLDWQENTPSELPFPILVSCLCQHWRIVAHHNAQLWCTIFPPQFQDSDQEEATKWVHRWLTRARNLRISIVADFTPWYPQKRVKGVGRLWSNIDAIVKAIVHCPERIRRLDIRSDDSDPTILKGTFKDLPMLPNLHQLSLQLPSICKVIVVDPSIPEFKGWFHKFPKLKVYRSDGMLVPKLQGLTTLSFRHAWLTARLLRDLLSSLPQLETLLFPTVSVLGTDSSASINLSVVVAPSLRAFAIDLNDADTYNENMPEGSGDHCINIFQQIRLPNLRYLELQRTPYLSEAFFDGIKQSFEHLETVHFSNPGIWSDCNIDQVILPTLSSLSNLRHLRFLSTRTAILNPTAQNDASVAPSTLIWPNILSITLCGSVNSEDLVNLCHFVKSHKLVEVVYLTEEAKRRLSTITMYGDEPDVWKDIPSDQPEAESIGTAEEWLKKIIRIETISRCDGLLDREGLNLKELSVV
ncbi:hypothetical protein CPB83DRAFT_612317 [Crepidotus variabilis]|uniref:F-box domain-containing protein n=1 Tax=Crepidotus variabilis TaxID=179855 RepID=A0A9P6JL42_9AGAR|nr:hypothetical protein CPB83DRAFT_612317 [Crepidotus variabilis]